MRPFVIVIVVVVVVFLVNAIRIGFRSKSHHFVCPDCGENFQVGFAKYMFTSHNFSGECYVKCPKCGSAGMRKPLPGEK